MNTLARYTIILAVLVMCNCAVQPRIEYPGLYPSSISASKRAAGFHVSLGRVEVSHEYFYDSDVYDELGGDTYFTKVLRSKIRQQPFVMSEGSNEVKILSRIEGIDRPDRSMTGFPMTMVVQYEVYLNNELLWRRNVDSRGKGSVTTPYGRVRLASSLENAINSNFDIFMTVLEEVLENKILSDYSYDKPSHKISGQSSRGSNPAYERVVVRDLVAKGIPQEEVDLLTSLFIDYFEGTGLYQIYSRTEIEELLTQIGEAQKLGVDCNTEKCMVEFGHAMNADLVIAGEIGRVGGVFIVSLSMYNIKKGERESRKTWKCDCGVRELIDRIPGYGKQLLGL